MNIFLNKHFGNQTEKCFHLNILAFVTYAKKNADLTPSNTTLNEQ